jgi:hypothetical protein
MNGYMQPMNRNPTSNIMIRNIIDIIATIHHSLVRSPIKLSPLSASLHEIALLGSWPKVLDTVLVR